MNSKKWTIILLVSVIMTLISVAGLMIWLDPLIQYGTESGPLTSYEYSEMYTNPGIAKNYEYDSVLVGTSMIQNTDINLFEELFGCKMVRLSYSGGTTYNMKKILELCLSSPNIVDTVYWELDEYQLLSSADEPRYPLPEYLYRTDHKEDIKYLLNLDIIYHYALKDIINTGKGITQKAERRGITFTGEYGRKVVLSDFHLPVSEEVTRETLEARKRKAEKNLQNIEGLVKAYPQTKFVFFLPPFSILYWERDIKLGLFNNTMELLEYVLGQLMKNDNVYIFFYQGKEDIITDLNNYKDYSHYGSWINDKITEWIAEGEGLLTMENYQAEIRGFKKFITDFDFEEFLNE